MKSQLNLAVGLRSHRESGGSVWTLWRTGVTITGSAGNRTFILSLYWASKCGARLITRYLAEKSAL